MIRFKVNYKTLLLKVIMRKIGLKDTNLKLIGRFYDLRILASFVIVYMVVYFFPFKFVPDYFHIAEIENFRTFIWSLFSVTLGFSGLILTLLLLSFNLHLKSTKRHTLEFIFENVYLKVLFSSFLAIVLLQLISFCAVHQNNRSEVVAVMYLLFLLTASYIIIQLPLAIIGLKYSTSIQKLDKVAKQIDQKDVTALLNRRGITDDIPIEKLESNKLIVLKDIGVNAIKDNDWILPQKILGNIFGLISSSLEEECPIVDLEDSILVNLWMYRHFQRTALKNSDDITMNVIMGRIFLIYKFLISKKVYNIYLFGQLDNFVKDAMISIIQSRDFSEIRTYFTREYTEMMADSIRSLNFDDDALPTSTYIFQNVDKEVNYPSSSDYYQFWHYLLNTQFDTLKEVLEFAMVQKDNRTFANYHWQIRSLLNKVASANELTESQKREYINDILYRIRRLESTALELKLIDEIEVISHLEIEKWAINGWYELFRSGMYAQVSTIRYLIKSGLPYNHSLGEFFQLGRRITADTGTIKTAIRSEILEYIIEIGLKIYNNAGESKRLKYDIQYQLNWLFKNFLLVDEKSLEIVEKYKEKIEDATAGFDYYQVPES